MTGLGASTPGKALICGEYAVLEGAPAVVAAVDRRLTARWSEAGAEMPPEVEATLRLAQDELGPLPGSLAIDVSQLRRDRVKLGLGSSAAAAAAAAAASFATHGHDLDDDETRHQIFTMAFRGHASIAPEGSGVDVAASTFGGFLRYTRTPDGVDLRPLSLPAGLVMRLVWTGHAARTSDLLSKVQALGESDPALHRQCIDRLSALSAQFASTFEEDDAAGVLSTSTSYGEAMGALGKAAGAPIVEDRLSRAMALARRFSGSAKPCGAGGGDVAIAFFLDPDAASDFELACSDDGLHPIDVSWGAAGARSWTGGRSE